ncbi:MAG: PKD domain-containing protein, partial [Methylobacter sp.]
MIAEKFVKQGLFKKNWRFLISLIFLLLIGSLLFVPRFSGVIGIARAATAPSLQIGNYTLISKRKAANSQYDFTYQATVSNVGTVTAFDVKAKAESLNPAIKLKNPNLKFGTVPAGGSVSSRDTFTLRKAETTAFNPADLHWQFDQEFAPTANAGQDQTVAAGATVYLDGSGSGNNDEDEDEPLGYQWSFVSKPADSTATLSNAAVVNPTFIADKSGTYTLQLSVRQEDRFSEPDSVVINTSNSPPVADAGSDQSVPVGNTAVLDGSHSSDADNDPLTFNWTITNKPATSQATLTNPTAVNPSFMVDKQGAYSLQLIVNDGHTDSEATIVLVTTHNTRPVAQAGIDQSAHVNDVITLDGSASSDVDGDALTYTWSLMTKPAGSTAGLNDPSVVKPTIAIDKPGVYVTQLIVHDAATDSEPDTVIITTENSKPIANPGLDQTVSLNSPVHLDGTASSDPDGDPLTYQWSFVSKPANSSATLSDLSAAAPVFTADKAGNYVLELIVNDGSLDSLPATITISTLNSRPMADAGADQTATQSLIFLDGTASSDDDNEPLTYQWSLLSKPANSQANLNDTAIGQPGFTADYPGFYVSQLIVNDGHLDSNPDTVTVEVPSILFNHPPVISSVAPITATAGQPYSYAVKANDPDAGDALSFTLTTAPGGMTIDVNTGLIQWTPETSQTGSHSVTVSVNDGRGGSDSQSVAVIVTVPGLITVPYLVNLSRSAAETAIDNAQLIVGTPGFINNPASSGSVISQTPNAGDSVAIGTIVTLTLSLGPDQGLPPDPEVIAPKINVTVATTVSAATEFLYSGGNPIQTGVADGTIDAKRVAVIRGKVLDKQNTPLPGVTITLYNHPELGQTLSRADGLFDLAVNGGGQLIVDYRKSGYLPVQRQVQTPWQDFVVAENVVMLALDTQVTAIDLSTAARQSAQGSVMTDADGSRQATLLFPAGTQATMTLPDGSQQALAALHVRTTEYTAGENGPKAMPGPLPPASGYTYAVELSADEALAAGAKKVAFDRPVPFYVDNFLGFPVGETVPAGWYDRDKAAWMPSGNGKVIKILAITDSLATIDSDGDNLADNAAKLAALGITPAEQAQLAGLYPAGHSLWRTPITHFTPWDCNWPYGPPNDATPPPPDDKKDPPPDKDSDECKGCSINPQARTVGEELPITGTPYTLHYQSRRTKGYQPDRLLDIPLSGTNVPASLQGIDLSVTVAGQRFTRSFTAAPNQSYRFVWDGLDAYGRPVAGNATATVTVSYRYNLVYYTSRSDFAQSFARASVGATVIGNRRASTIAVTRTWQHQLTVKQSTAQALGGWSLSAHHSYDAVHQILELGTGERRDATDLGHVISTVAGTGLAGYAGDGGPAVQAKLAFPRGIAIAPDGSLYIADPGNFRIRRVGADGTITTVAGTSQEGYSGDGGPATQAQLASPTSIAIGPDGSLYIADDENYRIRRVGADGIITTVAGTGQFGDAGDGGPATQAQLEQPYGVAVGPDGSLYFSDRFSDRIRRVGADGIITSVAGGGDNEGGDGGPATEARLSFPEGIAIGQDGSLYIADTDNHRIRRVGADGIITTVAGTGQQGYAGDGGPATQAQLSRPGGVAVDADGSLYIADTYNYRIRQVGADGIITTVAGTGTGQEGYPGDGGPAAQTKLYLLHDITIGPDGSFYIGQQSSHRIRRVMSSLPGYGLIDALIPSPDGSELYHFDANGRHLRTLNALTRSVLYRFSYDDAGRLNTITDVDGDITRIERDAVGDPTAIVAPDGQRTALTLDASGYLAGITNPAGETHNMSYTADGLVTAFTDPNGHVNSFTYDDLGRLNQDIDAGGGGWTVTATQQAAGYTTAMTTGEGRTTHFAVNFLNTGERRQTNTSPDGTVLTRQFNPSRYQETATAPDGTVTTIQQGPDPRFGMQAPVISSTVKTPSGLTATASQLRSAVLTDANDPMSLTTLTETATVNGKTTTSVFNAVALTFTTTSPASRTATTTIDAKGRPVKQAIPGLADFNIDYDSRGRLSATTQGTGADTRSTTLAYYDSGTSQGYLHTVTDALNRTVSYDYDLAGRVTRQTLADGRAIEFGYDAKGNLTSLAPPGRSAHLFDYTAVDQTQGYTPPAVDTNDPATRYSYNKDKQLELITRPDGQTLDWIYDSAGRLQTLTAPHGDTTYNYDSAGRLQSLATPDSVTLAYTYDGALMTSATLTGPVTGSVTRSYDSDFRTKTLSVNGTDAISFGYDNDSLLTSAGSAALGINLTLKRNSQNGLPTGTALGSLTDSTTYNGFGEVSGYLVKAATTELYKTGFTRDQLGRITQKVETVSGITKTFDYAYDDAGRLVEVKLNGAVQSSYG